jgi:hypothetical protein
VAIGGAQLKLEIAYVLCAWGRTACLALPTAGRRTPETRLRFSDISTGHDYRSFIPPNYARKGEALNQWFDY